MAVDNLPGELPRDASIDFGNMLLKKVVPSLEDYDREGIIRRASILKDGQLTTDFKYLRNYLNGKQNHSPS